MHELQTGEHLFPLSSEGLVSVSLQSDGHLKRALV